MGVIAEKPGVKHEGLAVFIGFIKRSIKRFIDGFMDFADKGFWYIGNGR